MVPKFSSPKKHFSTTTNCCVDKGTDARSHVAKRKALRKRYKRMKEMFNTKWRLRRNPTSPVFEEDQNEVRTVWVANVVYGASARQLADHFRGCGRVRRVTILTNPETGRPRGFASVEFADGAGTTNALALDESIFCDRQIRVTRKTGKLVSMDNRQFRGVKLPRWYFAGNGTSRMFTTPYVRYTGVRMPRTFALKGGLTPRRFYGLLSSS